MPDQLTFSLPVSTFESLTQLSAHSGYSVDELISLGIAAAKAILGAKEQGNLIIEATKDGRALQEIRFPQSETLSSLSQEPLTETRSLSLEQAISDLDPDFNPSKVPK